MAKHAWNGYSSDNMYICQLPRIDFDIQYLQHSFNVVTSTNYIIKRMGNSWVQATKAVLPFITSCFCISE